MRWVLKKGHRALENRDTAACMRQQPSQLAGKEPARGAAAGFLGKAQNSHASSLMLSQGDP